MVITKNRRLIGHCFTMVSLTNARKIMEGGTKEAYEQ